MQTRVDIKKLHAQTSSTAFRRHSISDCLLRSGNLGTQQRTRKNDSIDTKQDKGNTKRLRNKIQNPKKRIEKLTSPKCVALMTKLVTARAQKLRMTWTVKWHLKMILMRKWITTIEEEEWIDYFKRSIVDATEKMDYAKIRCWNRTHKSWNENWHWELQIHWVKDGWKRLLNGAQIWAQDLKLTERWEDREKDGKMTSMISSNQHFQRLEKMGSIRRNLLHDDGCVFDDSWSQCWSRSRDKDASGTTDVGRRWGADVCPSCNAQRSRHSRSDRDKTIQSDTFSVSTLV